MSSFTPRVARKQPILSLSIEASWPLASSSVQTLALTGTPQDGNTASRCLLYLATVAMTFPLSIAYRKAATVFEIPELRTMVLQYCDHYTLMAISRTGSAARGAVAEEIRCRIREIVSPFIPGARFGDFLALLHRTGAVIAGSVARRLMTINCNFIEDLEGTDAEPYTLTPNMNIIAPKGEEGTWREWLFSVGYDQWGDTDDSALHPSFKPVAISHNVGHKADSQTGERVSVSITQSRSGVIQVLLASQYTAQMNAISSTRVYCMFPNLATSPLTLQSDRTRSCLPVRTRGPYQEQRWNYTWMAPCGPTCPALYRKTVGDKGTASFCWNPGEPVPESRHCGTDYLLVASLLKWRFVSKCRNRLCGLYTPDPSRRRIN